MARNATSLPAHAALLAACFGAAWAAAPAHAHHGYSQFDRCTNVALEGEIASVAWANPHVVIDLKTTDVPRYRIGWLSLTQLEHAGIATQTLKAGDHVMISGNAMRDPALKVLSLVSEISRPSDGWSWTSAPRPAPSACDTH